MTHTIGVVGLGLLGRGITACLLHQGCRVVAVERSAEEHAAARPRIDRLLRDLVDQQQAPPGLLTEWQTRLQQATDWNALAECSFVIESVTEDLGVKQSVFDHLEAVVAADAVIASNTSAIPISVLQQSRRHPERFVGMHWAEPAHATRFLELIRGEHTSDATMSRTEELSRQLGKDPSVCHRDVPGFIVNRIAYAIYREALHLVDSGVADVETVDRSLRNTLGLWAASCGPFRWIDLSGGPALYAKAMARVLPTLSNEPAPTGLLARLEAEDARGIVDGHGFYRYTPQDSETWQERQKRHAWLVKHWLDQEFPLSAQAGTANDGNAEIH